MKNEKTVEADENEIEQYQIFEQPFVNLQFENKYYSFQTFVMYISQLHTFIQIIFIKLLFY